MQAELGAPLPDTPDCGGVQITVECSPCAGAASQVCGHDAVLQLEKVSRLRPKGVLQQPQGQAGEALSFELAKSLERSLNAHPSGRGMPRLHHAQAELHLPPCCEGGMNVAVCLNKPACINGVMMTDTETTGWQVIPCLPRKSTTVPRNVCRECAGSPSTVYCVRPNLLGPLHRCAGALM